jgi:uncharacterized ion transporter superfamily protein YfcC
LGFGKRVLVKYFPKALIAFLKSHIRNFMKLKTPNTIVLLLLLLTIFAVLTWIIPGGSYDRVIDDGREVVDPQTFQYVDSNPASLVDLILAPIKGFTDSYAISIILFVLLVAGAFSVIQKTGAFEVVIVRAAKFFQKNPTYRAAYVPFFMVLFSIMGTTFGMSEEVLIFIPLFLALSHALGYDSITGVAIPFVGAGLGFAGAIYNPFTVGIAQGLAEIALFSGAGLRFVLWILMTTLGIWLVARYAAKVHADPTSSPLFGHEDHQRSSENMQSITENSTNVNSGHILILMLFFFSLILLIYGVLHWGWYILELSGLFLVLGILSAVIGRLSQDDAVGAFVGGMKDVLGAALVIALSRSILLLITDANIIDTILFHLSSVIGQVPPMISAQLMLVVQTCINIFVPSGSGQAALTIPIMAPLGDLVGISRQTVVFVFQLGDGITNMIIPTSGITMGVLGMAKIPWEIWAKWLFPRMVALYILAFGMIAVAVLFGY